MMSLPSNAGVGVPGGGVGAAALAGRVFFTRRTVEPLLKLNDAALSHDTVAFVERLRSSALSGTGFRSLRSFSASLIGSVTMYATHFPSSENCGRDARGIRVSLLVERLRTT